MVAISLYNCKKAQSLFKFIEIGGDTTLYFAFVVPSACWIFHGLHKTVFQSVLKNQQNIHSGRNPTLRSLPKSYQLILGQGSVHQILAKFNS